MAFFNVIKAAVDEACDDIVTPLRQEYSMSHLGPSEFNVDDTIIQRTDFRLLNKRAQVIECSFFHQKDNEDIKPCVIYLHANGCSRLEANPYKEIILGTGANLFTFDFSACGKSQGKYSTIGWREQEDLDCIIQYLNNSGRVSRIAIWGRSMGAITTIFYAEKNPPNISCIILDSAFTDFKKVVKEMAETKVNIPGFLTGTAYSMIRKAIIKKSNFDVRVLKPISYIKRSRIPAFFGAAKGDEAVLPHHTQQLYNAYMGKKELMIFEGDHNSQRPPNWVFAVQDFLTENLINAPTHNVNNQPKANIQSFHTHFDHTQRPSEPMVRNLNPVSHSHYNSTHQMPLYNADHMPKKKIISSPQENLRANNQPHSFSYIDHSASMPVLPSMEVLKNYEEKHKMQVIDNNAPPTRYLLVNKASTDSILQQARTNYHPLQIQHHQSSNTRSFVDLAEYESSLVYKSVPIQKHHSFPVQVSNGIEQQQIPTNQPLINIHNNIPSNIVNNNTSFSHQNVQNVQTIYKPPLVSVQPNGHYPPNNIHINNTTHREYLNKTSNDIGEGHKNLSITSRISSNKSFASTDENVRPISTFTVYPNAQKRKPLHFQINLDPSNGLKNGYIDAGSHKEVSLKLEDRRHSDNAVAYMLSKQLGPSVLSLDNKLKSYETRVNYL